MPDRYSDDDRFDFEPRGADFFDDDHDIPDVPEGWSLEDFDDLLGESNDLMF